MATPIKPEEELNGLRDDLILKTEENTELKEKILTLLRENEELQDRVASLEEDNQKLKIANEELAKKPIRHSRTTETLSKTGGSSGHSTVELLREGLRRKLY